MTKFNFTKSSKWILCIFANIALLVFACKSQTGTHSSITGITASTTDTSKYAGYTVNSTALEKMTQDFLASKNVTLSNDDRYLYIHSKGIPTHDMMLGITNWQQQVPVPQDYTGDNAWSIPLHPKFADYPLSIEKNFMRGAIAIAINGVPVFNPLNNRGEDAQKIGELDKYGGHSGRADDYHYHIVPLHLQALNKNRAIAYALDGFPIYGETEQDGSPQRALDKYHGHEDAEDSYHYHASETYPYFMAYMVGEVEITDSQISPQARSVAVREALTPLKNAEIIGFSRISDTNFVVQYRISTDTADANDNYNSYAINYSWDNDEKVYTFNHIKNSFVEASKTYTKRDAGKMGAREKNGSPPPKREN